MKGLGFDGFGLLVIATLIYANDFAAAFYQKFAAFGAFAARGVIPAHKRAIGIAGASEEGLAATRRHFFGGCAAGGAGTGKLGHVFGCAAGGASVIFAEFTRFYKHIAAALFASFFGFVKIKFRSS